MALNGAPDRRHFGRCRLQSHSVEHANRLDTLRNKMDAFPHSPRTAVHAPCKPSRPAAATAGPSTSAARTTTAFTRKRHARALLLREALACRLRLRLVDGRSQGNCLSRRWGSWPAMACSSSTMCSAAVRCRQGEHPAPLGARRLYNDNNDTSTELWMACEFRAWRRPARHQQLFEAHFAALLRRACRAARNERRAARRTRTSSCARASCARGRC